MCDGTLTRNAGYSNMDIIINERTRTPRYAANHSEVSMSIVIYYVELRCKIDISIGTETVADESMF